MLNRPEVLAGIAGIIVIAAGAPELMKSPWICRREIRSD